MGEMIRKGILLHVAIAIVCLLSVFIGSATFGVIIGACLYLAYVAMMYGEGCQVGEHHCTVSATLERLKSEGKRGDEKLEKNAFDPKKGVMACAVLGGIPLILAVVNLIFANNSIMAESPLGIITRLFFAPQAFVTRWCNEAVKTDISGAAAAAKATLNAFDYGTVDYKKLISDVSQIKVYAFASDMKPLELMRLLYIPLGVLPAIAMLVGYLRGPKLREKTVSDMLKGSRKKQRRMRRASRQHQPRQAKPEI